MSKREEVKRYKAVQLGFNKDCEKFLQKYSELQSFSYTQFAKIWQEMSFSLVFMGKSSYDEFRHYTDIFLFECKKYHIYAKNIYIKVGAFYLMYGLYYKQPIKCFVKIRLTKDEFTHILEFVREMQNQGQVEPLYVYCKMMADDAFDFVLTQTMLAPDLKHFYENFDMCDNTFQSDPCGGIENPLLQLLENRDIAAVNNEYKKALGEYVESHSKTNLMVFKNCILDDIKQILNDAQTEAGTSLAPAAAATSKETDDDIGVKREMLKRRAMKPKE